MMHKIFSIKTLPLFCLLMIAAFFSSRGQNPRKVQTDQAFRNVSFITDPAEAEIRADGEVLGLSNNTFTLLTRQHGIMIIKSGYATEQFNLTLDGHKPASAKIYRALKKNYPLTILNEGKVKYNLEIMGIDSLSDVYLDNANGITGREVMLPYGKYQLILRDGKHVVYRGQHVHSSGYKPVIKLPVYSQTSFKTLTLDYSSPGNMEVSIGPSEFFRGSGLSSAFLNWEYLNIGLKRSAGGMPEYIDTMDMLMPSVFLLNWDFRMGGSIFKCLDICALGRCKLSPGFQTLGVHINGYNDVIALSYYYGFELSTRFPYFNLNLKVGNQIINGQSYIFDHTTGDYSPENIPIRINRPVVSFGLVINGPINETNNMIRLWKRPVIFETFRKKIH